MAADGLGAGVPIDGAAIERTQALIAAHVRVTPVLELDGADFGLAAFPLALKLESLQHSGSFKARGAFANLLGARRCRAAGVVAASGGNHGAAVAYAARRLGVPARIFVPTVSSPAKIAADPRLRRGAGRRRRPLRRRARRERAAGGRDRGALAVHAFDQRETLLGQGTLGRELSTQAPRSTRCSSRSAAAGSSAASPRGTRGARGSSASSPSTRPR